jgi:hypothetical protein
MRATISSGQKHTARVPGRSFLSVRRCLVTGQTKGAAKHNALGPIFGLQILRPRLRQPLAISISTSFAHPGTGFIRVNGCAATLLALPPVHDMTARSVREATSSSARSISALTSLCSPSWLRTAWPYPEKYGFFPPTHCYWLNRLHRTARRVLAVYSAAGPVNRPLTPLAHWHLDRAF